MIKVKGFMSLDELILEIVRFRDEREWRQFHTPKNIGAALSIEAAELLELMLWKTDTEVRDLAQSSKGHTRLEEELADVLIYALLLAYEVGINPAQAILRKLGQNAKKYPVALSKGNAVKYSERRLADNQRSTDQEISREDGVVPLQPSLFPNKTSSII